MAASPLCQRQLLFAGRTVSVPFGNRANNLSVGKNSGSRSFLCGHSFCHHGWRVRILLSKLLTVRGNSLDSGNNGEVDDQETAAGFAGNSGTILLACAVGFLTGISVVLFNNGVREIRNIFWGGIHDEGASWLRAEPIDSIWARVIIVPTLGGIIVSVLNALRSSIDSLAEDHPVKSSVIQPGMKVLAACFTLGSGNSLGPEGPSVEIGASIAKFISSFNVFPLGNSYSSHWTKQKSSLGAVGVAAGFSSGFNAAVAGCFFAVESVLWPSPGDPSTSLSNTTSMVIISSVIASVVSEIGLGSEPAFKVPVYDFRSFGELPLYMLLGIFCGFMSLALLRCTSIMISLVDNLHKNLSISRITFPIMGGFVTGMVALPYPEVLYWGFENVDILLESRNFENGLSVELLLQLIGVKIFATSICRASGLVGGYYAPSLFIGAATGMAYGKLISLAVTQLDPSSHFSILQVASPQAYGLVGMAATLAGVCQVPLTAVLLLFELTQDYRIVLPLLGAVGLSSWISSGQIRRETMNFSTRQNSPVPPIKLPGVDEMPSDDAVDVWKSPGTSLCEVESSLCITNGLSENEKLRKEISATEAMSTRYVAVLMSTSLEETLHRMAIEKKSCALIIDNENILIGLLSLEEIEEFCRTRTSRKDFKDLFISDICSSFSGGKCQVPLTAQPGTNVLSLLRIMRKKGVNQVPVLSDWKGTLIGVVDEECINITCRVLASRELLQDIQPANLKCE